MDARARFLGQFKLVVVPILREEGFVGSGNTYRRLLGDVVHVLHVQGSIYGGQCCVCLGIHLGFFPSAGGKATPDLKKLTEPDCEYRARLRYPDAKDTWWQYGDNDNEALQSAEDIKATYLNVGRDFFRRFSSFPDDFTRITPDNFADRTTDNCPPSFSAIRALLAQARIYSHLQRHDYANQFARLGLSELQDSKATGLIAEFRQLAQSPNG